MSHRRICCALLTTASMLLFGVAMDSAKAQHFKVVALAVSLMLPIIGVSTHYAVLGNAGAPSLVYDMRDSADAWKGYYEQSISDAAKAQNAADTLTPIQQDVCIKAKNESKFGRYSGSKGYGQITQSLDGVCLQTTAIVQTLQATADRTDKRHDQASNIIAMLTSIPKNQELGDVFARQDAFREHSN